MTITIKEWGYLEYPYLEAPYLDSLIYGQMAMQFQAVSTFIMAMQFRAVLYNTRNLRIMSEFLSRGQVGSGGLNAWGNTKGTGLNWSASSTQPGDFDIKNVNTDIVEQYWRSSTGVKTSIILKCDAEIAQGIFTDTLAILDTNLSRSAIVRFQGSDDALFSVIGQTATLQMTDDNVYWISPDLPVTGYRYWRLVIDDGSNEDDHIRIGSIVFGQASIFTDGAHTDQIEYGYNDFADTVETEGFTNVANSRALKRSLTLHFQAQDALGINFRIMREVFTRYRTTHKSLVIPTPSPTDMEITAQFAVFSKIVPPLAKWNNNYKGPTNQYNSYDVNWDEAR